MFFDDNKIKMARKPGKKQKEYPIGCNGDRLKIRKKVQISSFELKPKNKLE